MPSVRLNPSAVCAACVLALLCLLAQARAAEPQPHWAFQPVRKPALPAVKATKWVRSPVDAFVLAPLEQRRWEPSPAASRAEWLRRVTLDLTGLPPTPEEMTAFVSDHSPDAYGRAVERLLANPHYGERMAVDWLDAARFADTQGYQVVECA